MNADEAVTRAYNAVTGADDGGWGPDRILDALYNLWDEASAGGTVTDDLREALAKAWDEGVRAAGSYGHEDTWTQDMSPYTENPYRGDARS